MFNEWATPWDFYNAIDNRFSFTCDVCALPSNAKHPNFYTPDIDGLSQLWSGVCWMNPPYNNVPLWVEKAYIESQRGITVVSLLARRSSETQWWHEYVMRASELWFVKNRLWFSKGGVRSRSNHASVIAIFSPHCSGVETIRAIDTQGSFIEKRKNERSTTNRIQLSLNLQ